MSKLTYKENDSIDFAQIKNLYESVGWRNYTNDMDKLISGINNSSFIVSVYEDDLLVGLLRVISDEYTIAYIQDILVLSQYQNKGIGKKLIAMFLEKYSHVRQKILLTDNEQSLKRFYTTSGFRKVDELMLTCYMYEEKM